MTLLLPREHGAYGQLLLPLGAALGLWGSPRPVSWLIGLTAVVLFWAHEPLLVWLGQRGTRPKRERGRPAGWLLLVLLGVATCALLVGLLLLPRGLWWALGLPAGLGLLVLPWLLLHQEKTTAAELLVAVALSAWAVPVLLSKGVALSRSLQLWLVMVELFGVAVLGVRGLMQKLSIGWSLGAAGLGLIGSLWAHQLGLLPEQVVVAMLPTCGLAFVLFLARPGPRYLRQVGFGILAVALLEILLLARLG